jgi:Leucine-rich repeat (LRR) protein
MKAWLICAVALFASTAAAAIPPAQRDALLAFYNATGGPSWKERGGWGGAAGTECEWYGVACNDDETSIRELFLYDNGLVGRVPAEIRNLTDLQTLFLSDNRLPGPFPGEVAQLANLESFYMQRVGLTGTIPPQFAALPKLRNVYLDGNELTGTIPREFGGATMLEEFGLSTNKLTGVIPPELGNLANLVVLDLGANQLTGPIPKELGRLANLLYLVIGDNKLSGRIPPELAGMTSAIVIRADVNHLEGPIPPELGALRNLEVVVFADNKLTGKIPPELTTLPALKIVVLYTNQLEGPLSPELFRTTSLEELQLGLNPLGGTIPREVANATNLQVLSLYQAQLTGTIPAEIGALTKLTSLELQNNDLHGPIPAELGRLTNLKWFDAASNDLTGPLPRELGGLTSLEVFSVYENQLDGTIPPDLGNLKKLRTLYLTTNRFTGTIPDSLRNLKDLEQFYLGGNLLTGGIPTWIGELTQLRDVYFAYGQFTGPIPSSIGNLTKLETLQLNDNLLSGSLPRELGNLQSIQTLLLQYNQLSGAVPPELWNLTTVVELGLHSNQFTGSIPSAIGNLRKVDTLQLHANNFSGPLPAALGELTTLRYLGLGGNGFTGTIPKELGRLTGLTGLDLSYNALRGPIPSELQALTALGESFVDFHYNALYANDAATRAFINSKQYDHDFEQTQTVTPAGARVVSTTDRSAVIEWSPIRYAYDGGGYQVIARNPAGQQVAIATTSSKELNAITVRNLQPSTTYTFTVSTVTHPHDYQQNLIVSEATAPLQAATTERVLAPADVVLTEAPVGLIRIDGVAQNEDSFTLTNFGDVATSITFDSEGDFFTLAPTELSLGAGKSQVVAVRSIERPAGAHYGYVIPRGEGVGDELIVYLSMLAASRPAGRVQAEAVSTRVEVAGAPGSDSIGQARFRNVGNATLSGIIQSDQPWIVPPTEPVTIEPGQTNTINFRVARARRPAGVGALTASLSLVYVEGLQPSLGARTPISLNNTPPGVGVTRVTVVDTSKPPVTPGSIPGAIAGEIALFAPGVASFVRAGREFVSDISILNASDAREINDLRLYFTPAASTQSAVATLTSVASVQAVNLANVVASIYGAQNAVGSLQLRSASWQSLSTFAKMVSAGESGTLSGDVPVFRADRSAIAGQSTYLTGLPDEPRIDLYLQETSGQPLNARVEMLDAGGRTIGEVRNVSLTAYAMTELPDAVADGVKTIVVTNVAGSTGRLASYARALYANGESWSIVDWSVYNGFDRDTAVRVPYFVSGVTQRTPRRRATLEVSNERTMLALFNPTTAAAVVKAEAYSASGSVREREYTIQPRQTLTINESAAHMVLTPVRGELAVTARAELSTLGTGLGTAVPVVDASAGLRLGQSQRLSNLDDSPSTATGAGVLRTQIGLVETAGAPVTVRASMFLDGGQSLVSILASREFNLPANGFVVTTDLVRALIGDARDTTFGELHGLQLLLEVTAGDGAVVPYVVVTDGGTKDLLLRMD